MSRVDSSVSYKRLLAFFLPLAITPAIMNSTHSIVDSAMARLPYPILSIAVFAVVKSLTIFISAPLYMSSQVVVSLANDKKGYLLVNKVMWHSSVAMFIVLFLIGYTPLGGWILQTIFGLREEKQITFAYSALKIVCFVPLFEVLRDVRHGVVIRLKQTRLILPGILLRLVILVFFLYVIINYQIFSGIMTGSIAWVLGMVIEGIFIIYYIKSKYGSPGDALDSQNLEKKDIAGKEVVKFFLPLGLMISTTVLINPTIQIGLARSLTPTESLAAFSISWGVISIIVGPLSFLNQLALVFVENKRDPNWRRVLKFSLIVGLALSALTATLSLTSIGYWLLGRLIAVPDNINQIALKVLLVLSIYPFLRSIREIYWGFLMKEQHSLMISIGKIVNFLIVAGIIYLSFMTNLFQFKFEPAVLGAYAFTLGEALETILIYLYINYFLKDSKGTING